ncbi:MAG: hypothetical protein K8S22_17685, partial [Betaproteobacteria bacterium]|nr:hypothetical protein [Betaproteobacteria bacterium]
LRRREQQPRPHGESQCDTHYRIDQGRFGHIPLNIRKFRSSLGMVINQLRAQRSFAKVLVYIAFNHPTFMVKQEEQMHVFQGSRHAVINCS